MDRRKYGACRHMGPVVTFGIISYPRAYYKETLLWQFMHNFLWDVITPLSYEISSSVLAEPPVRLGYGLMITPTH